MIKMYIVSVFVMRFDNFDYHWQMTSSMYVERGATIELQS